MSRLTSGCVRIVAWLALAGAASPAAAHDFWIEPSTFRPRPDQPVGVALRVGDDFIGRGVRRNPDRIVRFVSIEAGVEKPIPGRDGAHPAGLVGFSTPGTHVLAYRSNHAFTVLDGLKFDTYLEEKGLERILARRRERGLTDEETREAYSRCSKSLVQVGEVAAGGGDRVIGLPLEIIADSNPYASAAGGEMVFRVFHHNKPLEGLLVTARRLHSPAGIFPARTDSEGRVRFTLDEAGVWLIACVHMTEAPGGVDAQWESLWASLTFELPSTTAPAIR